MLVGPTDGSLGDTGGLEVLPASEVIAMNDDPAQSVRTKKDSTLVRAAEAVRDGRASAMVSAGNTGATMASALLRMGRLPVSPARRSQRSSRRSVVGRRFSSTPAPTPIAVPSGWSSSLRWGQPS